MDQGVRWRDGVRRVLTDRWTDRQTYGERERQTDIDKGRETCKRADRQVDVQIDRLRF